MRDWAVRGICGEGHEWGKILHCGLQWCPFCGEYESEAHWKRVARMWSKVSQIENPVYTIITFPYEVRERLRTKEDIALADMAIHQVFKKHGYNRGVTSWHFWGDKSRRYNPHCNALHDGRWITEEKRIAIKKDLCQVFKVNELVFKYIPCLIKNKARWLVHKVKYITRATFTNDHLPGNEELAVALKGLRNIRWWGRGKWDNEPVHSFNPSELSDEDKALVQSTCPECGGGIEWTGVIVSALEYDGKRVGACGYIRLKRKFSGVGKSP